MAELQFCTKTVTENQEIIYYVAEKRTGKSEMIVEGRCSCKEDVKTGIPCPHVICWLKELPGIDYLDAFDARWRKDKLFQKPAQVQQVAPSPVASRGKKGINHS